MTRMTGEDFATLHDAFGLDADGKPPPLHPDLVPWVHESDFMGASLRHPLVYQVPYDDRLAGIANKQYAYKQRALVDARAGQQWATFVFLHERPYRVDAFTQIARELDDAAYWDLLSVLWIDTENLHQNQGVWSLLLRARRPGRRKHFMTDEERQFLADLGGGADMITIYRGTSAPDQMGAGLSWTLDKQRGEWFARRFTHHGDPVLLTGRIRKNKIVAYLDRRNECEVIAFPKDITIDTVEDLDTPNDE